MLADQEPEVHDISGARPEGEQAVEIEIFWAFSAEGFLPACGIMWRGLSKKEEGPIGANLTEFAGETISHA